MKKIFLSFFSAILFISPLLSFNLSYKYNILPMNESSSSESNDETARLTSETTTSSISGDEDIPSLKKIFDAVKLNQSSTELELNAVTMKFNNFRRFTKLKLHHFKRKFYIFQLSTRSKFKKNTTSFGDITDSIQQQLNNNNNNNNNNNKFWKFCFVIITSTTVLNLISSYYFNKKNFAIYETLINDKLNQIKLFFNEFLYNIAADIKTLNLNSNQTTMTNLVLKDHLVIYNEEIKQYVNQYLSQILEKESRGWTFLVVSLGFLSAEFIRWLYCNIKDSFFQKLFNFITMMFLQIQ